MGMNTGLVEMVKNETINTGGETPKGDILKWLK
jgi:hypothetical protein